MSAEFRVGCQVMCIKDDGFVDAHIAFPEVTCPKKNSIYTVRDIIDGSISSHCLHWGHTYIRLCEIKNPGGQTDTCFGEAAFIIDYFIPLGGDEVWEEDVELVDA